MKNDMDALKSGPNGTIKPPSSFRLIFIPLSLSNLSKHATKLLKFLISAGQAERLSHSPTDPICFIRILHQIGFWLSPGYRLRDTWLKRESAERPREK